MSQPNIPDITPSISVTRDDAINLLLLSIAMEELGWAHIVNAEGEKIQYALGTLPGLEDDVTLDDVLKVNDSVLETLAAIMRKEFVLDNKLKQVVSLIPKGVNGTEGPPGPEGPAGPPGPIVGEVGFSARRNASNVSSSQQLDNWTTTTPFYGGSGFNPTTGIYTVAEDGRYNINAIINYNTTAAISVGLGPSVNPSFVVRRIVPTATDLLTGLFPMINTNIALVLNLRAILGSSTVTLSGDVFLEQGDQIGIFYEANGLNIGINIGGTSANGTVWSMHKIAD